LGIMTYGARFIRRFTPSLKDLGFMTAMLVSMVGLTRLAIVLARLIAETRPDFPSVAIFAAVPFAAGAMLTRIVLNAESALIFSIMFSLLIGLMIPEYPIFPAFVLLGSMTGTGAVEVIGTRMVIIRAGLLVGLVNLAFAAALGMLTSQFASLWTLQIAAFAVGGGLLVGILVTALLPVVESIFRYISDFKLLELANPNHPALRELLLSAPGSYQHSMMVASLVEAG
ncbi:MAG: hypothetical protein KC561_21565, partial [Myxococcales bacterium]|nr:hypothetical protein [Myxococcales bacterium]